MVVTHAGAPHATESACEAGGFEPPCLSRCCMLQPSQPRKARSWCIKEQGRMQQGSRAHHPSRVLTRRPAGSFMLLKLAQVEVGNLQQAGGDSMLEVSACQQGPWGKG